MTAARDALVAAMTDWTGSAVAAAALDLDAIEANPDELLAWLIEAGLLTHHSTWNHHIADDGEVWCNHPDRDRCVVEHNADRPLYVWGKP